MKDLILSDNELISIIPKNKIFIMYFLCIFFIILFIQLSGVLFNHVFYV